MNKAYILSLNPDADLLKQWDFGLLHAFLKGDLWQPASFTGFDIKSVSRLPKKAERAIVAIPARHHKGLENEVNEELKKLDKVVLFLMGDEEADFNVELIDHPNIDIWIQNPHIGKHDAYNKLGTGFPAHLKDNLPEYNPKDIDIFFAGQITHQRRVELAEVLSDMNYIIEIKKTAGFTQGDSPDVYYSKMQQAKIAPCPSGAIIPDSFRLFEALEMMCIPIADQKTSRGETMEYWDWLFSDITPFPKVTDWNALNDLTPDLIKNYDENIQKITSWWINWKREFAYKVMDQLNA